MQSNTGSYYNDVIMRAMRLKSPASRFFAHPFQAQNKESIKAPRYWGLCEGNPPVTYGFPSRRASSTENASIWWRHHEGHESFVLYFLFMVFSIIRRFIVTFVYQKYPKQNFQFFRSFITVQFFEREMGKDWIQFLWTPLIAFSFLLCF